MGLWPPDDDEVWRRLRQQGLERAARKAGRVARHGVVAAYVHAGGQVGSLVELHCQTDFVARSEGFRQLAREIAMQVAATAPVYLSVAEAPAGMADDERKRAVLLLQGYIRDERQTVQGLLVERGAAFGEEVRIARFARFEVGR
jgi:elongation factor Ts